MNSSTSVHEILRQIEKWLAAHASRILNESLQPGTSAEELQAFELKIGNNLPDSFKELYRHWNGTSDETNQGGLFYGLHFNSLQEIERDWHTNVNYHSNKDESDLFIYEKFDAEIDPNLMLNPNWLSIASFIDDDCYINIDFSPAEKGKYGQIIFVDNPSHTAILLADTLEGFLNQFVLDLQKGLYSLNEQALDETGEHSLEPRSEIDLLNWYNSDRWKRFA